MLISVVLLTVGLVCLIKVADFLVNSASAIARRFHISEIVIGLTIVAFGTSAPELVVNIFASINNKNELTMANVIGSNIFNILLILGVAGVIYPLKVRRSTVLKEIPFSLAAVVVFFILANDRLLLNGNSDRISSLNAGLLLALFVGFLIYTFGIARTVPAEIQEKSKSYSLFKIWILIILGFAGLFLGGKLMVDSAVLIARKMQLSEKLIGLTIVSGGTSLPELATSVVAAYRRHADIAVGNIVGSNIFNMLFITGISGLIRPICFNTAFNLDLVVLALATLFLLTAMYTGQRGKLDRWEAAVMFIMYAGYLIFIIYRK